MTDNTCQIIFTIVLAIAVAPPQKRKDPSIDLLRFKNHDHE
jgi:hypothetical protein